MPLKSFFLTVACVVISLSAAAPTMAAKQSKDIPSWLKAHVGTGEGKIAPVVLQRARALYQRKSSEGVIKNPCYFAKDATRPSMVGNGRVGRRFYVICEGNKSFRAYSSGYGNGRKLKRANFSNGRQCAKNLAL